ncbi:MAG: hypothetical protein V1861_06010 [Candidatus Micrarchaeota archaeon]
MRVLILLALISLCGCIQHYESVPQDLKIVAMKNTCFMMPNGWGERVTIDSSGNGIYENLVFDKYPDIFGHRTWHIERKDFRLSEEELTALLNSINESGFFYLEGEDSGRCIWDSCNTIEITKDDSTKRYRNEGCSIKAYDDTEEAIWDITKIKTKSQ